MTKRREITQACVLYFFVYYWERRRGLIWKFWIFKRNLFLSLISCWVRCFRCIFRELMWWSLTLPNFLYTFCIVSNPLLQICDSKPAILLITSVWLLLHFLRNNFWKFIRDLKIKTEHILFLLCLVLLRLSCCWFQELGFACSIWATTIAPSLNTRLLWMLCILFLRRWLFRHAWYWFGVLDSKLL